MTTNTLPQRTRERAVPLWLGVGAGASLSPEASFRDGVDAVLESENQGTITPEQSRVLLSALVAAWTGRQIADVVADELWSGGRRRSWRSLLKADTYCRCPFCGGCLRRG
jgi:hypothetical protein